jgi:hypothetical protein
MITRIAYDTTDEVNLESATQTAQECGAYLRCLPDPVAAPGGSFAALLHDLDNVDVQRRQAIVGELLTGPLPFPVAVHGYCLGDEEMIVLQANGVVVSRQFKPDLVRVLCQAAVCTPTAAPDPKNRDSQGVSEDPAVLCGMVRSLATRAFRAMRRNSDGTRNAEPHEIGELRERIDQLQQHLDRLRRQHNLRLEELQRWLNSLGRCVEGLLAQPRRDAEE